MKSTTIAATLLIALYLLVGCVASRGGWYTSDLGRF